MESLQLQYMDCDSFVLSIRTSNLNNDLKNPEYLCDFRNLDKNHELFSNKIKKVLDKVKIETPKTFWIDEFFLLKIKSLFI